MAATRNIQFEVTAPPTLRYWLAVDEQDIELTNGKAVVQLQQGTEHVLIWWMVGNPGDMVSIIGKDGAREVVNVKGSAVPDGATKGAGYRRFTP